MIEFIQALIALTLWGSLFWGIAFTLLFLIICFVSDITENGFLATFFLVIMGLIFYWWGDKTYEPLLSFLTWKFSIIYLSIGLGHAFMRSFFHGREEMKLVNKHKDRKWSSHEIEKDIKNHVARWWFLWPISLLVWLIKDKLKEVWDYCWSKVSKVFSWFMELGIKSIPELPEKKFPEKK